MSSDSNTNARIRKAEDSFFLERKQYIVKKVDHAADNLLLDNGVLKFDLQINETVVRKVELTVYSIQGDPYREYDLMGTLKELHDLKDFFIPMMTHRGLDVDDNWVIIRKNVQKSNY